MDDPIVIGGNGVDVTFLIGSEFENQHIQDILDSEYTKKKRHHKRDFWDDYQHIDFDDVPDGIDF